MPRRNNNRARRSDNGRIRSQKGKGLKRGSSWHQGTGSNEHRHALTTNLPQTGAKADPTQAAPASVLGSGRSGPRSKQNRGDSL